MFRKNFNTIHQKISVVIGLLTVFYSGVIFTYFYFSFKIISEKTALEKTEILAQNYSNEIKANLESALDLSRSTAQLLSSQVALEGKLNLSREDVNTILRNIVDKNPFLLGVYTAWEPDKFDALDAQFAGTPNNHPNGHFVPYWFRDTDSKKLTYEPLKYYLVAGKGDYYLKPKSTKEETIIDPVEYKIGEKQVLLMTLVVPILTPSNEFVGIVGTDISSETIQNIVQNALLFEGKGKLSIYSNNGVLVANSFQKTSNLNTKSTIMEDLAINQSEIKSMKSIEKNDTLYTIVPIQIGKSSTPWFVAISVPTSYLTEGLSWKVLKLVILSLLFLGIISFITRYYILKFLEPLIKLTKSAQQVAVGDLQKWERTESTVEVTALDEAFRKVLDSQLKITEVAAAISKGDFSQKADVKSESDVLAKSINVMIDNLKTSQQKDSIQKWSNEGYAQFADLLRNSSDLKNLAQSSINYLIKYLGANQGGFFIVEGEKNSIVLELKAAYAYDRVKYKQKSIVPGEGLVGQVYLEKQTIYLTEIPNDYVEITSGLGSANPNSIIIVPLIHNEIVEGAIEIALFHKLETFQIVFLEKCASNLASSISTIRVSEFTNKLLIESQEQAEQVKMQEEEMRQNMEELAATQEEMMRKELEYLARIKELEQKNC